MGACSLCSYSIFIGEDNAGYAECLSGFPLSSLFIASRLGDHS